MIKEFLGEDCREKFEMALRSSIDSLGYNLDVITVYSTVNCVPGVITGGESMTPRINCDVDMIAINMVNEYILVMRNHILAHLIEIDIIKNIAIYPKLVNTTYDSVIASFYGVAFLCDDGNEGYDHHKMQLLQDADFAITECGGESIRGRGAIRDYKIIKNRLTGDIEISLFSNEFLKTLGTVIFEPMLDAMNVYGSYVPFINKKARETVYDALKEVVHKHHATSLEGNLDAKQFEKDALEILNLHKDALKTERDVKVLENSLKGDIREIAEFWSEQIVKH